MPADTALGTEAALAGLAWLLTYLLHSTVLLGGTGLLLYWWRSAGDPIREALWKFGILGGLASASLQAGLGLTPFGGVLELAAPAIPALTAHSAVPDTEAPRAFEPLPRLPGTPARTSSFAPAGSAREEATLSHPAMIASPSPVEASPKRAFPWRTLVWILSALAAVAPLLVAFFRTRAFLGRRVPVEDPELLDRLEALRRRAGLRRRVRLSVSSRLAAPVAMGCLRLEICLPRRALRELAPQGQNCMLAHELAHLLRGDPAWLAFCKGLELLLFVQPLNRLARRRLQEIAEFRCDALAAGMTGGGLGLARCLAEVAEWLLPGDRRLAAPGIAAMVRDPSHLALRIERLLNGNRPPKRDNRFSAVLAAGLLVPLTLAAPTVAATDGTAGSPVARAVLAAPGLEDPLFLPLAHATRRLEQELDALRAEVAALRERIERSPAASDLEPILTLIEERARVLGRRPDPPVDH